jgi:hypothetical protein
MSEENAVTRTETGSSTPRNSAWTTRSRQVYARSRMASPSRVQKNGEKLPWETYPKHMLMCEV